MNRDFLEQVFWGNSVKNYLLFTSILLFGLVFKRIFSRLLSRFFYQFLGKLGHKVHAERFIALLVRPVELLILFVTVYLAINQLDYPLNLVVFTRHSLAVNAASQYQVTLIEIIDKIFLFLFITSIFWIFLRMIDFVAEVLISRTSPAKLKFADQMIPFAKELARILTVIIGVFVVMGMVFNLNVATIIAGLGIGGLAIALAAQDTLQNLLGSFTIFIDKPFAAGDYVKVIDIEGTVEKVGFRSTQIRTDDNTLVTLPNKKMIDSALENFTDRNFYRVQFTIRLPQETTPEMVKKILAELTNYINHHREICQDTLTIMEGFGEAAWNIQLVYFIQMMPYHQFLKTREDINFKIIELVKINKG